MDRHEVYLVTVVGMCNGGNGRSCDRHRICGESVGIGTVIRFLITIVNRNEKMEYAIGAYRVDGGVTACLVGFVAAVHVPQWRRYEDRIGQVTEVKRKSTSYGSFDVVIIPKEIGFGSKRGKLPELGMNKRCHFSETKKL